MSPGQYTWKSDDGFFPAGFTGSGICELLPREGRREKRSSSPAVISTLHAICSMGGGIELAAVGVAKPQKVVRTMRDAIV